MANKPRKGKLRKSSRGLDFFLSVALLAVLAFIGGYLLFAEHQKAAKPAKPAERPAPHATTKERPAPKHPEPVPAAMPRVAIIIDDMGSDMDALRKLIDMRAPLDVAVLPMLRHSKDTAGLAKDAGLEVLLHLPMQPKGDSLKGLGPGALLVGMDGKTIKDTVAAGLETVPGAVGVNNHMGSALTEEKVPMRSVMEVLNKRGLFFVDSKTTSKSAATVAAREAGVRSASRRVFLDDSTDPADIKAQFARLIKIAKRDGSAIAIGHPHPNTLSVLKEEIPVIKESGVELVQAGKLVK